MHTRFARAALPAALAAMSVALSGGPAIAHITLDTATAPAGGYYKAVFRVGHGCSGSPTVAIRVQIPDGALHVKPQPKSGWTVAIVKAGEPAGDHGGHSHGAGGKVTEIAWTGGKLLDEHYDEFVLRLKLPDTPGARIFFPVIQTCETGELRWIEQPDQAAPVSHDRRPAPVLRLEGRR